VAGGFVDWAEELLAPFGRVETRRMFSAHGLYLDGLFVGIVWQDVLYLKATGDGQAACEAAGLTAFRPSPRASLRFYAPPSEAMDDPDALRPWVEIARDSARRSGKAKRRS